MGGVIVAFSIIGWLTPQIKAFLPETIAKLYGVTLIPYLWMFLIAALAAENKEKVIPFLKKYWWVVFSLLFLIRYVLQWDIRLSYSFFNTILLFGGLVGFAYAFPHINVKTDISYGVYIYHMTVINALIVLGFVGNCWTLWVVICGTNLLAWISTITIGRLSVKKKEKIS